MYETADIDMSETACMWKTYVERNVCNLFRWIFYDMVQEIEGQTASAQGISKSVGPARRKKCVLQERQQNTESDHLATPSAVPPSTAESEPSSSQPNTRTERKRKSKAPGWFDSFVEEERDRQNAWREEVRSHFTAMQNFQSQRLSLFQEAVQLMKNNPT